MVVEGVGDGLGTVGQEVVARRERSGRVEAARGGEVLRQRGADLGRRLDEAADGDRRGEQLARPDHHRVGVAVRVVREQVAEREGGRERALGVADLGRVLALVGVDGGVAHPGERDLVVVADEDDVGDGGMSSDRVVDRRADLADHRVGGRRVARIAVPRVVGGLHAGERRDVEDAGPLGAELRRCRRRSPG